MSLTQIVKKDRSASNTNRDPNLMGQRERRILVYSDKLKGYIPINLGLVKGNLQRYNIGLGPGSWY